MTDSRSFERGQAYFDAGQVRTVVVGGTVVTAVVDGGSAYRVRLSVTAAGLEANCSCPREDEGDFCEHCVAVALAWLDGHGEPAERGRSGPDHELREFLRTQDVNWLVDELLRAADTDPLLWARLAVAAGTDARDAYDDGPLRARLTRAVEVDDFIGYHEARSYFGDVDDALAEVAELIDEGFPDVAMSLAEHTLELLAEAGERIDDSDGGLQGAMGRAEEIHFDACSASGADPVRLAEYLAKTALASNYEVFLTALPDYAPVLGAAGMARYRDVVETAWRELPPKRAGEYGSGRFTATYLMERLAECEGGADAVIEVLARDVCSPYDVLRIAERLCGDGRDDEALEWLRRGMTDFAPDSRLRSLAAECHLRADRRAQAVDLLWANFASHPQLDRYIALHDAAADQFGKWRDRALALLGEAPAVTARFGEGPYVQRAGRSTLVEVLLWEGDTDAAWLAAVDGGCRDELWLRVARERALTHPADAVPVLLGAAAQRIDHKNRDAYRAAAALLVEAKALFIRCDRHEDFESHLRALRAAHKPKRALREELDRALLP
ncbi:SWIM zinc finger family protein [Actinokineospora sp.]|uniref:SWIM zinc finger family protein n=1 Tax=Actinokineospora sp. TaxID=1872133 RepID=UPI003D6C0039